MAFNVSPRKGPFPCGFSLSYIELEEMGRTTPRQHRVVTVGEPQLDTIGPSAKAGRAPTTGDEEANL